MSRASSTPVVMRSTLLFLWRPLAKHCCNCNMMVGARPGRILHCKPAESEGQIKDYICECTDENICYIPINMRPQRKKVETGFPSRSVITLKERKRGEQKNAKNSLLCSLCVQMKALGMKNRELGSAAVDCSSLSGGIKNFMQTDVSLVMEKKQD